MIGALFLTTVIVLLIYGYSLDLRRKRTYELKIEETLDKVYSSLVHDKSEYTSYLNQGHILYRRSRDDIEKELKSSIKDYVSTYQLFKKPNFCFNVDEDLKKIVFLNEINVFNLDKYVHFEDWKQGDLELKRRIEEYKRKD